MGGTPEFRIVFELTNERPQKSTVPQTARRGSVVDMTAHATRKKPSGQRRRHARLGRRAAAPYSSFSFFSFGLIINVQ
jgi:hypothetical protein